MFANENLSSFFRFHITHNYFYRLILSAVLLTSKFYNDVFYGNHFLAFVGGISLPEMNLLEAEFLKLVNWALWVAPEVEFEMYLAGVIRQYPDEQVAPVQSQQTIQQVPQQQQQ